MIGYRPGPVAVLAAILVAVFLLMPLLAVVPVSFTPARFLSMPNGQLSLRHYQELFDNPAWGQGVLLSLRIGIVASVIATSLAVLFGLGIWMLRPRFTAVLVGFVLLLIVDQLVKAWVRGNLRLEESRAWWPGVFELRRTYNEGIAFGMLRGKGVWLTPVAVVIAVGAVWYVYRHPKESRWNHAAFGLLAAGAVGNLYDRVVMRQVTDMFWFRLIDFPVFNVADACITVATP